MSSFDRTSLDERYLNLEWEGRAISSGVAIVASSLTLIDVNYAVSLLIVSMSFDLVRCAYRKHLLEPAIVVHHIATISVGLVFLCKYTEMPLIRSGTSDLVRMEVCNPFLHAMWILSKDPRYAFMTGQKAALIVSAMMTLILWPYFRIWRPLIFLRDITMGLVMQNENETHWFSACLVMSLVVLQFKWFVKIAQNIFTKYVKFH